MFRSKVPFFAINNIKMYSNSALDSFINHNHSFLQLKTELNKINCNDKFKKLVQPQITSFKDTFSINDIDNLRLLVNRENANINFNNFGYYKHTFYYSDILNANLIVWGPNAKTNIHIHPENGCFIYNIYGIWKEDLYNSTSFNNNNTTKKTKTSYYHSGRILFIDDEIGAHQVTNLSHNSYALSLNIYSPNEL